MLYRSFPRVSDGRTRLTLASYANISASGNSLALAVQDTGLHIIETNHALRFNADCRDFSLYHS